MTLVTALIGRSSIWLCADRRLTYSNGHFIDTGMKISSIGGTDGSALLGYAGLGASIAGTEPSAWMNDLLKDSGPLTIDQNLQIIGNAMRAELPRHLVGLGNDPSHALIAVAMVDKAPILYELSLRPQPGLPVIWNAIKYETPRGNPVRSARTGSGANRVVLNGPWHREVGRIIDRVEKSKVIPQAVADRLAKVNQTAAAADPYVSAKCVVKWTFANGGGGFQFYDGHKRVHDDAQIPEVANGMDTWDIVNAMMPMILATPKLDWMRQLDKGALEAAVNKAHDRPARKL